MCLGLTPTAARWLAGSLDGLAALTGHPVRWDHRLPGEPAVWPEPDAIVVAPATFNTVNRWALGLTDTWLVAVATEGMGKRIPVAVMPCVNSAYAAHPRFDLSWTSCAAPGCGSCTAREGSCRTSRARGSGGLPVADRPGRGRGRAPAVLTRPPRAPGGAGRTQAAAT